MRRKGLARVIASRGELERSERAWRQVLDIRPNDAEALTGLAQTLSWQGRPSDAETALQLALQANPAYGDARTLLRWVRADLRPSATITALGTNDSDHNRATTLLGRLRETRLVEHHFRREIHRTPCKLRRD